MTTTGKTAPAAVLMVTVLAHQVAADRAPTTSAVVEVGSMAVMLVRIASYHTLTLLDRSPIDADVAEQWAAGVGAPHRDWWVQHGGARWSLTWWARE